MMCDSDSELKEICDDKVYFYPDYPDADNTHAGLHNVAGNLLICFANDHFIFLMPVHNIYVDYHNDVFANGPGHLVASYQRL